jgi:hypothetical protein
VQWSKVSGPGTVTFGNAALATTTATFSAPGAYVLRLTATSSAGSHADDIAITVQTLASILGSLYHSDFDLLNSSRTMSSGIASLSNLGPDGAPAIQATGSRQPTYSAAGFNGLPCLTTDGGDALAAVFNTPLPIGARSYVFLVAARSGAGNYPLTLQPASDSTGAVLEIYFNAATSKFSVWRIASLSVAEVVASAVPALDAARRVIEAGFTASGLASLVVSGTATNAVNAQAPVDAFTLVSIGAAQRPYPTPIGGATASIAQAIVCSGQPTPAQILAVRNFLKTKWGAL